MAAERVRNQEYKYHLTYPTNTLAKRCACRERMEDMDRSHKGFLDFAVISKFGKGVSLLLENVHDRIDRMAVFELLSEGMADQFHPRLFLITLQGGVEEHLELEGRRVTHLYA
jgi:hypothetical protein